MKIALITPYPSSCRSGNSITAIRYARLLKSLKHELLLSQEYDGRPCDMMIALHARRSFNSIRRFHQECPDKPLIVVLTGTDLYRDIHRSSKARLALEMATRLVVLQRLGLEQLPERFLSKARVIYQSARATCNGKPPSTYFKVCVIGNLRREKDPMRAALASRLLPAESRVRVIHIGRAMSPDFHRRALAEGRQNPRYRYLGEMPHWRTLRALSSSHLLALTSRMEGSSNVLCEALALGVPVIASKIAGLIGTLGEDYPGYFPVGDERALARLLHRAESDGEFYRELKLHCARAAELVRPERERRCWRQLIEEVS
jgi:putative glycosyltransferase (TIGR04348 family)